MKKRIFAVAALLCAIVALFSFTVPAVAITKKTSETPASVQNGAREARFLNMLNHNFVYNETFDCIDDMINTSVPALLSCAEDEFIAEGYVFDYINDMYGIEVCDISALNTDWPQKDGYLYIIPRGYSLYEHSIIDCLENEDGSFTVTTEVKISDHDSEPITCKATTLFVVNENSSFGYNIIYSNLHEDANEI